MLPSHPLTAVFPPFIRWDVLFSPTTPALSSPPTGIAFLFLDHHLGSFFSNHSCNVSPPASFGGFFFLRASLWSLGALGNKPFFSTRPLYFNTKGATLSNSDLSVLRLEGFLLKEPWLSKSGKIFFRVPAPPCPRPGPRIPPLFFFCLFHATLSVGPVFSRKLLLPPFCNTAPLKKPSAICPPSLGTTIH